MGKPVENLVIASECVNPRFTVPVRTYLFGQFRIQICDRAQHAPEWGSIVRELCIYRRETCDNVVFNLSQSVDPLAMARTYERPGNCENEGGRHPPGQ